MLLRFRAVYDCADCFGYVVADVNLSRPRFYEFVLRLRESLALALHFEQQRAATKAYNEIDGFLDIVAASADLFQGFDEFVLIVVGSGCASHHILFDILVKLVERGQILRRPALGKAGAHFIAETERAALRPCRAMGNRSSPSNVVRHTC